MERHYEDRVQSSLNSSDVFSRDIDHDPMNCVTVTVMSVILWVALLSPALF